jgi:SPP1 family predicted phage head-tail adaptor
MAKIRSASDLDHRIAFDSRTLTDDGYGNSVGEWIEQFRVYAGFTHLRGGEAVIASRLQGQHVQVIFVRASAQTREVSSDWRIRDVRTGVLYNIRDITPTEDRKWIDFLTQAGVAAG